MISFGLMVVRLMSCVFAAWASVVGTGKLRMLP